MSAPSSRRRDPFRPPDAQGEATIELARPAAQPGSGPAPAPLPVLAPPKPRAPTKYRRTGASWVTLVVLGFAAVGIATVGGSLAKKLTSTVAPVARLAARPTPPVIYHPLAKDDAVLVEVKVTPAEARLMLDGEPLASNPVRLPRGPRPHKLAAAADGYAPIVEEFTADKAKTLHVRLPRARR